MNCTRKQSFLNIFKLRPHTTLASAQLQWLILNCNQTLQANFLAFWNNLVSQVRDLIRPWNFWKHHLLDKQSWLMTPFSFLMIYLKICPSSEVTHQSCYTDSQWHWSSRLHKGYYWYKCPAHTISRSWDTTGGRILVYTHYPLLPMLFPVCSL